MPQPGSAVQEWSAGWGGICGSLSPPPLPELGTGVEGTWHPLGRLLPAPAVGPRRTGRGFRSQQAAAASAPFVGSQLLIGICEWSRGVRTAGKGTGARWQRMEQGITLSHPVGTVSEPPNLVVAERARLWGKGFEDIPKPTPSHKALSCAVFPSSLGPPERSLQTLRGAVALRVTLGLWEVQGFILLGDFHLLGP